MPAIEIMSPVQIVQFQLEALNRHDLADFVRVVSSGVRVTDADGAILIDGKTAFATWYELHFDEHPNLKIELLDRISLGEWVVDEVLATNFVDDSQSHLISIIKVVNGEIESYRIIQD